MSQQFREIDCVARRCKRGARHRLLRLVKVLEVPAAHRFVVPTGGALGRNGETVVVEHLEQTRRNFVGAVSFPIEHFAEPPPQGSPTGLNSSPDEQDEHVDSTHPRCLHSTRREICTGSTPLR